MRRKAAIALMLALVLFASTLSAAAAFREGFYGDYYYELVATCSGNDVYIRTSCENRSYTAKVSADIYRYRVGERYTTMGQSLQNQASHWRVHLVSRLYLLYLTTILTAFS